MKAIETDRLIIRRFTQDDMVMLHHVLDEELLWAGRPITVQQRTERMLIDMIGYPDDEHFGRRAVVHKEIGEVIGYFGFRPELGYYGPQGDGGASLRRSVEVEFHYALSPRYHRRRYGTECFRALLRAAFEDARLDRVFASTEEANLASSGLMRKVGMSPVHNPRPGWPDRLLACLSDEEYQRVQRTWD